MTVSAPRGWTPSDSQVSVGLRASDARIGSVSLPSRRPTFSGLPSALVQPLGRGSVFRVDRLTTAEGRPFILKRPADPACPYSQRAIERERDILAAGRGRNLPALVASGSDRGGFFVVETHAPGDPVRRVSSLRPLPAQHWLALARDLSAALAALHSLGDEHGWLHFVHGDLSPDNIFYSERQGTTFVDWSAGVWRGGADPVFPDARGTLPYAAPELVRAECHPDETSDVYALASVLLWLAVDRMLDADTEVARLAELGSRGLRTHAIARRDDLPVAARQAICQTLAFDPTCRSIRRASELAARLS